MRAAVLAGLILVGCGGQTAAPAASCAQQQAASMLVVLDGSGSMRGDGKWAAATAALDATFDAARGDPRGALALGLTVFADTHDATIGATHAGPYDRFDVPPAPVDAAQDAALHARLDGTEPWLGTPTYEVLSGQYPLLEAEPGRRVLVLVTDGVPDPRMPAGANEQPWSIALAARERARGVATWVVGVGPAGPLASSSDYDPLFVARLAAAGGTEAIQLTPGASLRADLASSLDAIRANAACAGGD